MLDRIKQLFSKGSSIKQSNMDRNDAMENSAKSNKRRHPRQDVEIQGKLSSGDHEYPVDMLDLSKSGAKLMARNGYTLPENGQMVTLTLSWPLETDRDDLCVDATVVRVDNNEISVHFSHIEQNSQ